MIAGCNTTLQFVQKYYSTDHCIDTEDIIHRTSSPCLFHCSGCTHCLLPATAVSYHSRSYSSISSIYSSRSMPRRRGKPSDTSFSSPFYGAPPRQPGTGTEKKQKQKLSRTVVLTTHVPWCETLAGCARTRRASITRQTGLKLSGPSHQPCLRVKAMAVKAKKKLFIVLNPNP